MTPRLVIVIPLEGSAQIRSEADTLEDELRLVDWLRRALSRREPLTAAVDRWLDDARHREVA